MKIKDVKILWGRAGNRCSFPDCKIELTIAGDKDTLGEMAHIVAKSPDGPRANPNISTKLKDSYDNHILLCPTHHKVIDRSHEKWTVDKLKQLKKEHEKWVSLQLEKGSIKIPIIDNIKFLDSRVNEWQDFANQSIWIISSITPLNITEDIINPLEFNILNKFNCQKLPEHVKYDINFNKYNTKPNANGVINELLPQKNNMYGYRSQLFRNGHYEFLITLEPDKYKLDIQTDRFSNELVSTEIIPYTSIVYCFNSQIQSLSDIWQTSLPFNDMELTTVITNTNSICLDSCRQRPIRGKILGSKVSSNILKYSTVISKDLDTKKLCQKVVKRFVNYFGLVIDSVFDEKDQMIFPGKLRPEY